MLIEIIRNQIEGFCHTIHFLLLRKLVSSYHIRLLSQFVLSFLCEIDLVIFINIINLCFVSCLNNRSWSRFYFQIMLILCLRCLYQHFSASLVIILLSSVHYRPHFALLLFNLLDKLHSLTLILAKRFMNNLFCCLHTVECFLARSRLFHPRSLRRFLDAMLYLICRLFTACFGWAAMDFLWLRLECIGTLR